MNKEDFLALIKEVTTELLPELNNPSATAEYALWQDVFAHCAAVFSKQLEYDRTDILNIIEKNRGIGTEGYFRRAALEFQWKEGVDYTLIANPETLEIQYNIIDLSAKIVKQSATAVYSDNENRIRIIIKTAREVDGKLAKLTQPQLSLLSDYIKAITIPGQIVECRSLDASVVDVTATVYYDRLLNVETVKSSILASLNNYSKSLDFNGKIYRNKIIDSIQSVAGVIDVNCERIRITEFNGATLDVKRLEDTQAGYININEETTKNQLTFIAE